MNHKVTVNNSSSHPDPSLAPPKTCSDITVEGMTRMRGIPGHSHLNIVRCECEGRSRIYRLERSHRIINHESRPLVMFPQSRKNYFTPSSPRLNYCDRQIFLSQKYIHTYLKTAHNLPSILQYGDRP